jgi:ribonuclease P protein component
MLSKRFRLSHQHFIITKTRGKSYSTPYFAAIVYRPATSDLPAGRQGQRPARFSVVLSAKSHKSAVVRNRLRRQIYDLLRATNYLSNADIILFPKSIMLNLSREEIGTHLYSFLSKISS